MLFKFKRKISIVLIISLIFNQSVVSFADTNANISIDDFIVESENKNYAEEIEETIIEEIFEEEIIESEEKIFEEEIIESEEEMFEEEIIESKEEMFEEEIIESKEEIFEEEAVESEEEISSDSEIVEEVFIDENKQENELGIEDRDDESNFEKYEEEPESDEVIIESSASETYDTDDTDSIEVSIDDIDEELEGSEEISTESELTMYIYEDDVATESIIEEELISEPTTPSDILLIKATNSEGYEDIVTESIATESIATECIATESIVIESIATESIATKSMATTSQITANIATLSIATISSIEISVASVSVASFSNPDLLFMTAMATPAFLGLNMLGRSEVKEYVKENRSEFLYNKMQGKMQGAYLPTNWAWDLDGYLLPYGVTKNDIEEICFKRKSEQTSEKENGEISQKFQIMYLQEIRKMGDLTIYYEPEKFKIYIEFDNMWKPEVSGYIWLPSDCKNLFAGFPNLKKISRSSDCVRFNNITDAEGMFKGDTNLTDIDLIPTLPSISLLPQSVIDSMLTEPFIVSIGQSNALAASSTKNMFKGCKGLGADASEKTKNFLEKLKFKELKSLEGMFSDCTNFDAELMRRFFLIANIKDSNNDIMKDFSKIENASSMFSGCEKLSYNQSDFAKINSFENVKDLSYMFAGCTNLWTNIGEKFVPFAGKTFKKLKNISSMFQSCTSIKDIDMSFANECQLTNIAYLFYGCSNLKNINDGTINFDTKNCNDMSGLLRDCRELNNIKFGDKFITASVSNMQLMFNSCTGLTQIDISSFSNKSILSVSNIENMFSNCPSLNKIIVGDEFAYDMAGISTPVFYNDTNLKGQSGTVYGNYYSTYAKVDYGIVSPGYFTLKRLKNDFYIDKNWCDNMPNDRDIFKKIVVTNKMSDIPIDYECAFNIDSDKYLHGYYQHNYGTHDVTLYIYAQTENTPIIHVDSDASGLFSDFTYLEDIEGLEYFDFKKVTDASSMFKNCTKLNAPSGVFKLDLNWSNLTDVSHLFDGCESLENIELKNAENINVEDSSYMFNDCINLSTISNINNLRLITKNSNHMFANCKKITCITSAFEIDLRNATNTSRMFYNCEELTNINVDKFQLNNSKDVSFMFSGCEKLSSLDLDKLYSVVAVTTEGMFKECKKIVFDGSFKKWDTSNVENMSQMFDECEKITELRDFDNIYTNRCTDLSYMFAECSELKYLNLDSFNTASASYLDHMFYECISLSTIFSDSFDLQSMLHDEDMFFGCTSLKGSMGTTYDGSQVNSSYARIDLGSACNGYFSTYIISSDWFDIFENEIHPTSINKDNIKNIEFVSGNYIPSSEEYAGFIDDKHLLKAEYLYMTQTIVIYKKYKNVPLLLDKNHHEIFSGFVNLEKIESFESVSTSVCDNLSDLFSGLKELTFVDTRK